MTCNPIHVGARIVESHVIGAISYAQARPLAEGCGAIVYWDPGAMQATVRPALAPAWNSLPPLVECNRRWPVEYQMHQARFDHIWAASLRKQVDPLLMVAILLHEGTGSFNTNPANADQYNGNGPDADWIADTRRAVSHVAGKLVRYHQARGVGFTEVAASLGFDGNAIQFVGWPGPIWDHQPTWGPYAQHAEWWRGVSRFYEALGGSVRLLTDYWSVRRVDVPWVRLRCEAVTDRADLCSDLTGRQPRPGVVTWVE